MEMIVGIFSETPSGWYSSRDNKKKKEKNYDRKLKQLKDFWTLESEDDLDPRMVKYSVSALI